MGIWPITRRARLLPRDPYTTDKICTHITAVNAFRSTLTEQEALAGVQPPRMSRDDWRSMYGGSLVAMHDALQRTHEDTQRAIHHNIVYRFIVCCTSCADGTVQIALCAASKTLHAQPCDKCRHAAWSQEELAAFEYQLSSDTMNMYSDDTIDECC